MEHEDGTACTDSRSCRRVGHVITVDADRPILDAASLLGKVRESLDKVDDDMPTGDQKTGVMVAICLIYCAEQILKASTARVPDRALMRDTLAAGSKRAFGLTRRWRR